MQGKSGTASPSDGRSERPFNHLRYEKSPYLKKHVRNPVDWFPWGDEAFSRAVQEDKPVFLSIGYATCHWCHVMARESFEDDAVAAILNEHYISIKVDREERPDIDAVYMMACQQMTGQGGWPLSIITTPAKEPFFAGTYFPRSGRAGMPGLLDLLPQIARIWAKERGDLERSARVVTEALRSTAENLPGGKVDSRLLTRGYEDLALMFDPVYGGFGRAPKFPTPTTLQFLLRFWKRNGSDQALNMVTTTLDALSCGGIHDQLGGGFHRYSTDASWRVPHFEKMLYDQALLLTAFSDAWLATKNPVYRETAKDIVTYLLRDLQSDNGGFIAAEDADTVEGEGAYYSWTLEEFTQVLGRNEAAHAARHFGVTASGNFVVPESNRRVNVLILDRENRVNSQETGLLPEADDARIKNITTRLLLARNQRPRPARDTKILADWNGLAIAALAHAYRASGDPACLAAAEKAMQFVRSNLRTTDGGLFHRYCDGEAAILGFADDYAFMIAALLELYGATFDPRLISEAIHLEQYLTRHFSDPVHGGYYSTPDNGDPLIVRTKEIYDGALPSSNSVMLQNLVTLGYLTGNAGYTDRASSLAAAFFRIAERSPSAYTAYLCGLDDLLGPATCIVIAGDGKRPDTEQMIREIRDRYLPATNLILRTPDSVAGGLDNCVPFTSAMTALEGKVTAYICHGTTCSEPVTKIEDLVAHLEGK
ncbi:MAG: thioredoxin domain-containing protein [Methanomicrobiales archaeon HGW-Methanomicrobiales-3]|nr:MAG: thioredoxin domain-containing protein [Methanomicrobiales archaeon HGW-Methanomicrobiales-3]